MEVVWEDPPVSGGPFFTRDLYEKYSLAPTIRELKASLQSPEQRASTNKCDVSKDSCPVTNEENAECTDHSFVSCDSNDYEGAGSSKNTVTPKKKLKQEKKTQEKDVADPEPRLPFPCTSTLSSKEQMMYLESLKSKNPKDPPPRLKALVDCEVMQFMRYLQDVAKICAEDYNFISQGAMQYTEELFRCCLECINMFPQLYQICEMTSLTGGTFNPGLTLTFEKQLLIMGNADITDFMVLPADVQLASDYHSVSSASPPAKKAKDMHAAISSDVNAEKLSSRYEPDFCLTRDALVRLLDNHGPEFGEQWELPVWVKVHPENGRLRKKTVYIDSPLLKTQVTVRERNRIYNEESLKLSVKRNGSLNVFRIMTELPNTKQQLSLRNQVSAEGDGIDFDVDLTDLETFGETTSVRTSKQQETQNKQHKHVQSEKSTRSSVLIKPTMPSGPLLESSSKAQREKSSLSTDEDCPTTKATVETVVATGPNTKQPVRHSAQESDDALTVREDSDDEKLVIDDSLSPTVAPNPTSCFRDPSLTPVSKCDPPSSPEHVAKRRRHSKKAMGSTDQLGEILRMQTAMFSSAKSTASTETTSTNQCTGPSVHPHQVSLVKPCVSSYLERSQNQSGETCALNGATSGVQISNTDHKRILSEELQAGAEDELEYEAPEKGSLLYKLYSLQDLLLMVRSSVSLTQCLHMSTGQSQYVPVHVLPKLEYQLSYGVECLTSSEACQLWTERALHSSTVSCIAHINAHTSKVAVRRRLRDNWQQDISCGFKPSKSLNILHHLLKKLAGLEGGKYLITHKSGEPFVTLMRAVDGAVGCSAYNLQQAHSSIPQPPASGPVPWIPVDPAVVLPFHKKHGRVPCTFPPRQLLNAAKDGPSQAVNHGGGGPMNVNAGAKKKKQKKRAAKRKKYMQALLQKSLSSPKS